jgi:hypothetical protein
VSTNDEADDGKEYLPSGAIAFWVEGAPQEQRDAHFKAERWAHALPIQIDRLWDARRRALADWRGVEESGHYPNEARFPFMEMDAEAYFVLVAARQLLRALRAFDGNDRMPEGLTNAEVRDVRDALEHWDQPGGRAARAMAKRGADPAAHVWTESGPGVLGEIVQDAVLRQWGLDVYADLQRWDPFDGWRQPVS